MKNISLKVSVDVNHLFPSVHAGIGVMLARISFCRKHGLRAGQIVRLMPEGSKNEVFAYFKIVPVGMDAFGEAYSKVDAVVEPFIAGPEGETVFSGKEQAIECALAEVSELPREESAFVLKLDTDGGSQGPAFARPGDRELRELSRFVGEHRTPLNNGYVLLFNGKAYVVRLTKQRSPGVAGPRSNLTCYIQYLSGVKQGYENNLMEWQRKRTECEAARDTLNGELASSRIEEEKLKNKFDEAWRRYKNSLVEYLEELEGGFECLYEEFAKTALLDDFFCIEVDGGRIFGCLNDIDNMLNQVDATDAKNGRLQNVEAMLKNGQKELTGMRKALKTCVEEMEAQKGFLGDYSRGAGPRVDFEP